MTYSNVDDKSGYYLEGFKHHVIGGHAEIDKLFVAKGSRSTGFDRADIVVFTGGADVSPDLYGHQINSHTKTTPSRDRLEKAFYEAAGEKYKVGICRGAQFLHVMNGGVLFQHVDGHGTGSHEIIYRDEKGDAHRVLGVTSTHHQMMKQQGAVSRKSYMVWGVANESTKREFHDNHCQIAGPNHWQDCEIICYPDTYTLCFQPHPEYPQAWNSRRLFHASLKRMIWASDFV